MIALTILAAGDSTRMGAPKGLLPFFGRPFIAAQADAFRAVFPGADITVVLGTSWREYHEAWPALALGSSELTAVVNPAPQRGSFSSLRTGLAAVPSTARAVFVLPVDVPSALPETWLALRDALSPGILAATPRFGGRGGHPVLLSRDFADRLLGVSEDALEARLDVQLRALSPDKRAVVDVDDATIGVNLNDPAAWRAFCESSRAQFSGAGT